MLQSLVWEENDRWLDKEFPSFCSDPESLLQFSQRNAINIKEPVIFGQYQS
jgi:hypothetical protein